MCDNFKYSTRKPNVDEQRHI